MTRPALKPLRWSFFGSSLVSAYWNGAATYYRGLIRCLAESGHEVTFYEPDAYERQQHRDISDPPWATVRVYANSEQGLSQALASAAHSDVLVKASGVGVFDEQLEQAVVTMKTPRNLIIFWDVDAPATLARMEKNPLDPFRSLVPRYDLILTYGGGTPVVRKYRSFGAQQCVPIYNALDPTTHFRVQAEPRFDGLLGFLGNRLPDREQRVEDFFFATVRELPEVKFLLGGNGWDSKPLPKNVSYLGHVFTYEHNAFNSSARAVLNICRESMADYGFCPPTRIFEAAGARACIVSDAWSGMELFLVPGKEVLMAREPGEVAKLLRDLTPARARAIGEAAYHRVSQEHTYAHRTKQLISVLAQFR